MKNIIARSVKCGYDLLCDKQFSFKFIGSIGTWYQKEELGKSRLSFPRCYLRFYSVTMKPLFNNKHATFVYGNKSRSSTIADGFTRQAVPHLEEFNSFYQTIVDDLTNKDVDIPPAVAERLIRVMDYNVLGGKKIRGLTVILAYHMLSRNSPHSQDMQLAYVLGWCVEMLQSFFIILDDIMDNGTLRRGKPCWFRLPDVGFESANDALLLESSIYKLIKAYFFRLKHYDKIINELLEVTRKTIYGQCLDMNSNPVNQPPALEKFTLSYYNSIVKLKTSYYTFCLPVFLAMHLIGSFEEKEYEAAEAICLKLGYLFQVQDDYLDAYGRFDLTGKSCTDIKEGKCTWFSATALDNCTEEEKVLMKENYGVDDQMAVQKVLQLYDTMGLKEKYFIMEESLHAEILSLISELNAVLNPELFRNLLSNIYKREK